VRLIEMHFHTAYAQVELSDAEGLPEDVPGWDGDTPVAATPHYVTVATKPDIEGPVHIEVWRGARDCDGVLIYDDTLVLRGSCAQVGSSVAAELRQIDLGAGEHRVQVFVDEPGYAERVTFNVLHDYAYPPRDG
jgi:hypothetical protein